MNRKYWHGMGNNFFIIVMVLFGLEITPAVLQVKINMKGYNLIMLNKTYSVNETNFNLLW